MFSSLRSQEIHFVTQSSDRVNTFECYRVPTIELSYANKERHRYHNHALVLRLMTTELKTPKDIVQHEKDKDKPTNSMLKTGKVPSSRKVTRRKA